MKSTSALSAVLLLALAIVVAASPEADSNGKYNHANNDNGKYVAKDRNTGKYMHMPLPYRHIGDMRQLGIYHHVHNPYGGGYGPYFGLQNPYVHDSRGIYVPPPTTTPRPTTTTKRPTTTTTTTIRPRLFDYFDEGGWRIIRQKEKKEKQKYDFLYLTENGIYGEEMAHVKDMGTMSQGYYEYTGDDGKLYKVNYNSGKGGFMPMGEHIPTIPPQIKKALEYTAKKQAERAAKNGNGNGSQHAVFTTPTPAYYKQQPQIAVQQPQQFMEPQQSVQYAYSAYPNQGESSDVVPRYVLTPEEYYQPIYQEQTYAS